MKGSVTGYSIEELAFPLQVKYLGKPIFYGTTEVGPLNQIVHAWGYQSQADREEAPRPHGGRSGLGRVPAALGERGYLISQENRIVKSTSFSPI